MRTLPNEECGSAHVLRLPTIVPRNFMPETTGLLAGNIESLRRVRDAILFSPRAVCRLLSTRQPVVPVRCL